MSQTVFIFCQVLRYSPFPLTRRQAIIWTNNGIGNWHIYASLGLGELIPLKEPWKMHLNESHESIKS